MNTDRTANANLAPRCQHTKLSGSPCAAPARRGRKYCVFHEAAHAKRPDYAVRLVEDAMSLQLALFQVMRALDDHALDPKRAALKLYALQIAASNLKRLHQETQEITDTTDNAHQKSLMEMFLDSLQFSDEEKEELFSEAEAAMHNASAPKFTIQACAAGLPPKKSQPPSRRSHRKLTTENRKPSTISPTRRWADDVRRQCSFYGDSFGRCRKTQGLRQILPASSPSC